MKARDLMLTGTMSLGLCLTGCQQGGESSEANWSSKSSSILGKDLQNRRLNIARPVLDLSSYSMVHDAAIELLLQAVDASEPLLRANAIEALHPEPRYLGPAVQHGLVDENRGVRFVSVMTVGRLKMVEISHLVQPLLDDESDSVRAAAIYALKSCGIDVDLSPLGRMVLSDNVEVRANTAFILGELGNPSAIPMLRAAAMRGLPREEPVLKKIVNLQIAEAIAKLGSDDELEVIRAALFAPAEQGEVVALACQMCGRLKDNRALPNLLGLALREGRLQHSAEVRMAAAMAVSLISPAKSPLEVPRKYMHNPLYGLRAQAALTMGASGRLETLNDLSLMLSDEEPIVQVAAAGAILRISVD